ncbi:sulfite exporter TauE/SafE family protein [Sutcliffiella deserti]|uniref:sulfite exporter TauE/SafE family protein n=1 Tax=Sutcliffiella deserti TaxID=2875501 RepID=UPI001CBE9CCE|nr:sulfite exporter TauE/SafE family protein [Sutcliffiella deserti]
MEFLLFIVIGFSISMLSGFFGIGGGFVLTPVLLLIGYSPIEAISTSLMYTIGTSISGVYAHFKMKNIQWKAALIIGFSGVVATQIAYPFVNWLEAKNYDEIVIPIMYLVLLSYFAFKMLKKNQQSVNQKTNSSSIMTLIIIGVIGGFLSTTLGVGGGFIIVPLLISFYSLTSRQAVATSLASVILIVTAGFITYAVNNPIPYDIGFLLIGGAVIGSQLGARATNYVKNKSIQKLLGYLYIVTMAGLILQMLDQTILGLITLGGYTIFVNVYLAVRLIQKKVFAAE